MQEGVGLDAVLVQGGARPGEPDVFAGPPEGVVRPVH